MKCVICKQTLIADTKEVHQFEKTDSRRIPSGVPCVYYAQETEYLKCPQCHLLYAKGEK